LDLQHLRSRSSEHAHPGPHPRARPARDADGAAEPILRLQRLAGNRAVGELLRTGGSPPPAVQRAPTRRKAKPPTADQRRRTRATQLKAADARAILEQKLPFALATMTDGQVAHMQKVLDAEVVNPEVEKEARAIDKRAVIRDFGYRKDLDPRLTKQAARVRQDLTRVTAADARIRLDHARLLTKDALSPRTDNPDEQSYLNRVANTLAKRGIYLRFASKRIRDPEDPSSWTNDPRSWDVWLSLGPEGDTIPTKDGRVDRESLLKTSLLGAGYYENVHAGPAQSSLNREIKRLQDAIEMGIEQHTMLQRIRDGAFPGVAEISDALGGASFPDTSAFDQAHKLVVRALEFNVNGNLAGSQAFLVVAGVLTRNGAQLLRQYIDDTSSGAERAVKVLKVAKTAGQVAEVGLAITGIPAVVRGGARLAAGEAATGAALSADVELAAKQLAERYAARNGIHADELAQVRWVKGPKGSVAGGVKPGTSSGAGQGFHKLY